MRYTQYGSDRQCLMPHTPLTPTFSSKITNYPMSSSNQTRLRTQYGPWALVTGATSGIGEAITQELAQAGLNLVLHGRQESKLIALRQQLTNLHPIEVRISVGDMGQSSAVDALLREVAQVECGLAVMAAGFGTSGAFLDGDLEAERDMLRVNAEAVLHLTHTLGKRMREQGRGGLILFSSLVAFQGVPYAAHYAATKAYIQSLAEGLYHELRPHGVDVLAAAPGPVASGFGARADMKMDMTLTPQQVAKPILKALGRRSVVRPGFLSKFLIYSLATMPRWARVRMMQVIMGGMTKHQRVGARQAEG